LKKNSLPLILVIAALLAGTIVYILVFKKEEYNSPKLSISFPISTYNRAAVVAREKAFGQQIKPYLISKKFNEDYCILVDMSQPSNKERLFLYNIAKDSIIKTGLVAHGTGSEKRDNEGNLIFSNVDGSLCTSLGKYKIGLPYKGIWGYAYRLMGLDSSNSNALKRAIVLHAHACVPEMPETNNYPICFSYGCPMTNPATLTFLI
jgi:hypothetical protein